MNWKAPDDTALIVVDMTYDFLPPDGALKVERGDEVIPVINALVPAFKRRVWTREGHPPGHGFFAESHPGKKPLDTVETQFGTQYLWPAHSIEGTKGAQFHEDLRIAPEDMVVVKGRDPDIHAYSAVYMDDRKTLIRYEDGKTLPEKLREAGIGRVAVCGLAYDFCAGFTAYDLAREGFGVVFIADAARSINLPDGNGLTTVDLMDRRLAEAGVKTVNSADLPKVPGINGPACGRAGRGPAIP